MPIGVSLALVILFLAMNAFFVIAEFAMVRVRSSQVEMALHERKRGAAAAKIITQNLNDYLSACQLGITLASLALGWLGEPAFSALMRPLLSPLQLPDAAITATCVAIGYILMTTLHVVAGELVPKSFAIFATEKWALRTAWPLLWFYRITFPVMWLFNGLTNRIVRLTGHDAKNIHTAYTDKEIKLLIDESTKSGLIDPEQNRYVDNIFDIWDKDAEAIMTPRTDMVCLDMTESFEHNLQRVKDYKYSRYPVCRGSKDRIVGFVHLNDIYVARDKDYQSVEELNIRPIIAITENVSVARVLKTLQSKRSKIAIVVDEHGGTSGMVTLSDIVEQIVGRIDDEYDHGEHDDMVEISSTDYLIDGSMPIDEVVELIGFSPKEVEECETAAGLLFALFDRIPEEGEAIEIDNPDKDSEGKKHYESAVMRVAEMDNLRIEKIRVSLKENNQNAIVLQK